MKALLSILFVIIAGNQAFAAGLDHSVSVGIWNAYILDNGFAPNKEPGIKADLFISHSSGPHLDLWGWVGLTRHLNNEIDVCPGYSDASFKVDLCYYEIANPKGVDMTAPSVEIYPGKGWTVGTQYYFGTTGDRGKKFWARYAEGPWSGQVSYTDFFGRVTALKGSWTHPLSESASFSATIIVPIADPDNTGNNSQAFFGLERKF